MVTQMQKSVKKAPEAKVHVVDKMGPFANQSGCQVYKDYDCMLNQTNIGNNNNKFYVIQIVQQGSKYHAVTRWGRVGEPGSTQTFTFTSPDEAIKIFEKKFSDKTQNKWSDRRKFVPKKGKYTMIEVGEADEDEDVPITIKQDAKAGSTTTKPSSLDKETQNLIKLILDKDMFKDAMAKMEIDVKKMPLGKLSKLQIMKGFQILDEIQKILRKEAKGNLTELSNQFYTAVPHDFGRQRPPVINTEDLLRAKLDMLITLSDIELAQEMLKKKDEQEAKKQKSKKATDLPAHPLDQNYEMLKCKLTLLKPGDEEFKVVQKYFDNTKSDVGGWTSAKKLDAVWKMEREPEAARIKQLDGIKNRKLLWHGTNVAVVAAILKSGLRIMPHAGGRVGRGLYFASECAKSAGYVSPAGKTGIMFLNEVVLGKEKPIVHGDSSLTKAPPGYHSVVAQGWTEPDPKHDTKLKLDGTEIIVPQGKPITRSDVKAQSHFSQSEYLVYQENQVRMRYLLKCNFA